MRKHLRVVILVSLLLTWGRIAYPQGDKDFVEFTIYFDQQLKQYKEREINGDQLFNSVIQGAEERSWAIDRLFRNVNEARDKAFLNRLLDEANSICLLPPGKRGKPNKIHIEDGDYFIVHICSAAEMLTKMDRDETKMAIKRANEQCRLIIEQCSDYPETPESILLDVIEKSNSGYLRSKAVGCLNTQRKYLDKERVIDVLKKAKNKLDRDYYNTEVNIVGTLKKLGIEVEQDTGDSAMKKNNEQILKKYHKATVPSSIEGEK